MKRSSPWALAIARSIIECGMLRLVVSVIGENLSRFNGRMGLLFLWLNQNCHWNCHTLTVINQDRKEKDHWQIFRLGWQRSLKPIRCRVMPDHPGISFDIWILKMKTRFATER